MPARLLVLGIDSLSPSLVFERWRGKLPALAALMQDGLWGPLRSTDPPITVPAWAAMLTGRDPGELGLYGFSRRSGYDPTEAASIVTGDDVEFPWLWDLAGAAGMESLVVGVPPTWPPRRIRGRLISDFLSPGPPAPFTWPEELSTAVEAAAGGPYLLDASEPRSFDPGPLVEEVRAMTERRFRLFTKWLEESHLALAIVMEIGLDRMQHALWHHMDPAHPRYPGPNGPFEDALFDYHLLLDRWIGRAVAAAGPSADVLVVSDHGAQAMEGCVRLNEWLRRQGRLVVESGPDGEPPDLIPWGTPLSSCRVDWRRSVAWAEGGYSGRVHLNLAGRWKDGALPRARLDAEMDEISRGLLEIAGPDGMPLRGTEVLRPRDVYREVKGMAPDLLVYLGGLRWRALGTVGTAPSPAFELAASQGSRRNDFRDPRASMQPLESPKGAGARMPKTRGTEGPRAPRDMNVGPDSILSPGDDRGPDGANHSKEGVLILREAGSRKLDERLDGMVIQDVFQTALGLLGLEAPAGTLGTPRRTDR